MKNGRGMPLGDSAGEDERPSVCLRVAQQEWRSLAFQARATAEERRWTRSRVSRSSRIKRDIIAPRDFNFSLLDLGTLVRGEWLVLIREQPANIVEHICRARFIEIADQFDKLVFCCRHQSTPRRTRPEW